MCDKVSADVKYVYMIDSDGYCVGRARICTHTGEVLHDDEESDMSDKGGQDATKKQDPRD